MISLLTLRHAKRSKTPTYVLTLELDPTAAEAIFLEKQFHGYRHLYNSILNVLFKRYQQFIRRKDVQQLRRQLVAVSRKFGDQRKQNHDYETVLQQLITIQNECGLSETHAYDLQKEMRKHFSNTYQAIANNIASRAWNAIFKLISGEAVRVNFVPKTTFPSFEAKANDEAIRFKNKQIHFHGLKMDLIFKNDLYEQEALLDRTKFCRLVRKEIRNEVRYFVQLMQEGIPPVKRKKDGSFRHALGKGTVGMDVNVRTVGIVTQTEVDLHPLCESLKDRHNEIARVQRKIDRSIRTTNPQHYNKNGTIKKGKKTWIYSNRCKKLKATLKQLHQKQASARLHIHRTETNRALRLGDHFIGEKLNFQSMMKRSKVVAFHPNGKRKRTKRFGKSVGHTSPGTYWRLLKQKVIQYGGQVTEVDTMSFCASQYDHQSDTYQAKTLADRWHVFSNQTSVQRDLYSAFLLQHSQTNGKKTDRKACLIDFDAFYDLHEQWYTNCVHQLKYIPTSGLHKRP